MLQAGLLPAKTRLPLVLYKGLLRKAQLFDRYPILKAYSKNPLRRGTLYIPSVSFHTIVKESFRIPENESGFDWSRGFKLYREWNDVYIEVSKKITWFNQYLPECTKQKEPVVKHIECIIPGSVIISHPAHFEKNEGSEIVLILQRNEYETMGLIIKGKGENENNLLSMNSKGDIFTFPNIESQEFAEELKDFDDEQRKYFIVDTSGDVNSQFKIDLDKKDENDDESYDDKGVSVNTDYDDEYDEENDNYDSYEVYDIQEFEESENAAEEADNIEISGEQQYVCELEEEEERDLDQIADDGRGRKNSPSLLLNEIADGIHPLVPKSDFNAKTIYKGGARFTNKFVVVYTRQNISELEGDWLSENLYFSVFPDKEAMMNSKIVTLPPHQYRIFQGYHLLQTETVEKQVADGSYFVCHTPLEILHFENNLDDPPVLSTEEMWSKILMEMGGEFSHFAYSRKGPVLKEKSNSE